MLTPFHSVSVGKVSFHSGDLAQWKCLGGRNAGKVSPLKFDLAHQSAAGGQRCPPNGRAGSYGGAGCGEQHP